MRGLRSAIVVPIRLPAAMDAIRFRETANARVDVPAHVTLLFPFVPPPSIDAGVLASAADVLRTEPAFDARFRQANRWDPSEDAPRGLLWLPPEPAEPFIRLVGALAPAFPDYPPYGGIHDTVIPHVTVATDDAARYDELQPKLASLLPFRRRVTRATLIVEGEDGRWRTRCRFALGA